MNQRGQGRVSSISRQGQLQAAGATILSVEQNVERALAIADRACSMDQGKIVHHDTAANLIANKEIQERYCSV